MLLLTPAFDATDREDNMSRPGDGLWTMSRAQANAGEWPVGVRDCNVLSRKRDSFALALLNTS